MSTFDELWEGSLEFRGLFIGSGRIFPDWESFDKNVARVLWSKRKPKIKWTTCAVDGCRIMVREGDHCSKHVTEGDSLPLYRWVNARLYKIIYIQPDPLAARVREYENYEKYVAEQRYGLIPRGWEVGRLNGNPFDMSHENITIMTKISMVALAAGYINPRQASELDSVVSEFVAKQMGPGVKPFIGIYGYDDIARVARCKVDAVRRESREGTLDPCDLLSVMDFVRRRRYGEGSMKLVADGQG